MHRHILTLLAALLTLASPARATDRTLTAMAAPTSGF